MTKKEFFDKYYNDALKCEQETKIPALFTLAQAAVESGWGEKAPGNMIFGIKAGPSWDGLRQLVTTREVHSSQNVKYPEIISITKRTDGKFSYKVKDWFRAYDSPADSFIDHGKFLTQNKRYANAFLTKDPYLFTDNVAGAGYATDPNYAATIKSIIKSLALLAVKEQRDSK